MTLGRTRNRRRVDSRKTAAELLSSLRAGAVIALRLSLVAAGLAAVGFGAWWGWKWAHVTDRLAIERIAVEGNTRASESELLRLAGLQRGLNLVALDARAAERAIAAHPWVDTAEVRRRFPDGLDVRVVEHVPVALVALGELYLVDAAGHPFKRLQLHDEVDLPLVTGVDRDDYVRSPDETAARVAKGVEVAEAYAQSPVGKRDPASEVRLERGDVAVITDRGLELRFGEGSPTEKLRRLERIQRELDGRNLVAEVIHLDNRVRPDRIAVRLSIPLSERKGSKK